jgi:hypothetical protein
MIANVPAVVKKVEAMLSIVYARNMNDIVTPLRIAYAANIKPAVIDDMEFILALSHKTNPISAPKSPHKRSLFVAIAYIMLGCPATIIAVRAVINNPQDIQP